MIATSPSLFSSHVEVVGEQRDQVIRGLDDRVAGICHIGKRQKQDDNLLIFFNPVSGELTVIVEDGMGGHKNSDVATQLFKEGARGALQTNKGFAETFQAAEMRVLQAAWESHQNGDGALSQMGLAYVAAQFQVSSSGINFGELAWKGDSRGYLIRPATDQIRQLTWDHSFASMRFLGGRRIPALGPAMDAEDYYRFAQENKEGGVILAAVKLPKGWDPSRPAEKVFEPERVHFPHPLGDGQNLDNQPGDLFLFCSDGALVLPWARFKHILTSKKPLTEKVVEFRDTAIGTMAGPNRDNLTIVLVENRAT